VRHERPNGHLLPIRKTSTPSAATLVDMERDGQTVPALVQTTKIGVTFVLNRETGEPSFPSKIALFPPAMLK